MPEMCGPVKDKIGQDITEGSIIAYGHALGRCAGLRIGKVLKIKVMGNGPWESNHYQPRYLYRITVLGIDDDWLHNKPKLCTNKGCLQFPSRVIVLDATKLSEKYIELLGSIQ